MTSNNKDTFEEIILDILQKNPEAVLPFEVLKNILNVNSKNDNNNLKGAINSLFDKDLIVKKEGGSIQLSPNANGMPETDKTEEALPERPDNSGSQDDDNGYSEQAEQGGRTDRPSDPNKVVGKIDISRRGTGYLISDRFEEDVMVSNKHLGTALQDDEVEVKLFQSKGNSDRRKGKITKVLKRGREIYVGTFAKKGSNKFVIKSDENSAHTDFYVQSHNVNGAKPNDKVIFELLSWTDPNALPEAKVVQVLGKQGTNDADILSILAENQIKAPFPQEVEDFAEDIPYEVPEKEIAKRKDLRDEVIFTIDPDDAKDFDDAISIKVLQNGNYYLGVHIADVTHYMPRKSILDEEAYNRATSVYLVDRVIPMLPEKLSNGVCSLRPHEDKLAYSCFMEIAPNGKLVDYSIEETVIHSKQRFTYEQAQEVIDGKRSEYSIQIQTAAKLAHTLIDKRFKEGSINFDTPEPKFILDDNGKPVDVKLKQRLFAHRLVEECMLMANRTVAIHIENLRKQSDKKTTKDLYPFFYRIHDKPDIEKLRNIEENVKPIGIDFRLDSKTVSSKAINTLLKDVEDTSLELTVNDLMLRAMSKAEYSPDNIGHFGLGFKNYAHFTSPIRRYPDVIVHRQLKSFALGKPGYSYSELKKNGTHCSEKERSAISAERDSIKLKQVEYLSDHVGDSFDGVISGVMESGIFVDLKDIHCEGMVRVSDLTDDYYQYDEKRHCLVGRSNGKKYQLGKEIRVKVVNTDKEKRQIDLELADT